MTQRITSLIFKSLFALVFCFTVQNVNAQTIYALTKNNQLLSFSATSPTAITKMTTLIGLLPGQNLVGLDTRPRTGELYALGYNPMTTMARLYKLNPNSGILTPLGTLDMALSLGISADNIGMDFNPTVDRIRVVSTNKKNYRLHPDLGTLVATDTDLSYGMGDPNESVTPQIGQIAYTNSYVSATKTTLYYLNEVNSVFGTAFVATNPNNGQIKTIGNTGLILNPNDKTIDMDVAFDGQKNTIFLAANTSSNADQLYTINPTTGAATLLGDIGATPMEITDIAVAIDRTIPALKGNMMYALTTAAAARLVSFDDANPSIIRRDLPITGVKTNQILVGMDMRPQDFKLYALGYNVVGDTMATIYTLNDSTGVATIFADSIKMNLGATANIGFDFNPTANRLRIVSAATNNNYRLNLTVKPIKPTIDTALTFKTSDSNVGKTAYVGSVAYTNSFIGATATKMYDIDEKKGLFLQQNSPNGGFLNTIGSLGIVLDSLDYSVDMDIAPSKGVNGLENTIFLTANVLGGNNYDNLYNINVATGATTLIGRIGNGIGIRDIASKLTAITTASKDLEINTLNASFFPNPTQGNIGVSFENQAQEAVNIAIFGINGAFLAQEKFIANGGKFSETIDLSGFETGIYFIKIQTGNKIATQKVVKF